MPYLIAYRVMELKYVAMIQLVLIVFVGYDLYKLVSENILPEPVIEEDVFEECTEEEGTEEETTDLGAFNDDSVLDELISTIEGSEIIEETETILDDLDIE